MKRRRMQIHSGFFPPPPLMGFEQLCPAAMAHSAAFEKTFKLYLRRRSVDRNCRGHLTFLSEAETARLALLDARGRWIGGRMKR